LGAVADASIYGVVQAIFPIARGLADAGGRAQRQDVVCGPDGPKIAAMMRRYFYVVAIQGTLQVLIIVVMARFATGI
jgi:hypothetical protein